MSWTIRRLALVVMGVSLLTLASEPAQAQFSGGGPARGGGGSPATATSLEDAGKQISFEFVLIDRGPEQLANEKGKHPSAAEILELEKQNKLGNVQRLKLVALENVESRLVLGESAPMATSRVRQGGRGGEGGLIGGFGNVESITYMDLGTTVLITAKVDKDGTVVANFNVQRSSFAPQKAAEKTEGQDSTIPYQPRRLTSTVSTAARLASGETIVLGGQQTLTGATPGEMWVLVTAKVQ